MTLFDLIFLVFFLLFAVGGLVRGFIREMFTLIAVLGAIWAGVRFGGAMSPLLYGMVEDPQWRLGLSGLLLGLAVFVVLLVIGRLISNAFHKTAFSPIDRLFGFLFGAGRALLLLALVTTLGTMLNLLQGDWWEKAMTRPLAQHSALLLGRFVDVKALIVDRALEVAGGEAGGLLDAARDAQSAVKDMKELERQSQEAQER